MPIDINGLELLDLEEIKLGEFSIPAIRGNVGERGPKGEKGVGFRFLGEWDVDTIYGTDTNYIDVVSLGGNTYICKKANCTGLEEDPFNKECWEKMTERGGRGLPGPAFRHLGEWDVDTVYGTNENYIDVVSFKGSSYMCKDTTGSAVGVTCGPLNKSYWDLLASKGDRGLKGDKGDTGTNFTYRGEWNEVIEYGLNKDSIDLVTYEGSLYACESNNGCIGTPPPIEQSGWYLVVSKGDKGEKGDTGERGPEGYDDTEIKAELNKLKTKLKRYENSNISGQVEDKNISIRDSNDLPLKSFNVVGNMEQSTENAIPYKKAESTYLHLTNITHKDTKNFNVIGNTEQETYKDINKFNEADFARQNSEYYSYDNKTGLRVLKADGRAFDGIEYITLLKPNTTYYIKVENISNLSSMQLFEYSSTSSYIKANTLTENGTITTSNNCSCVKIKFLSNTCPINIGHVIISEEDISYQPIESPSLDYPSEVRACGNINLFNLGEVSYGNANGIARKSEGSEIRLNGTTNGSEMIYSYSLGKFSKGTYSVSAFRKSGEIQFNYNNDISIKLSTNGKSFLTINKENIYTGPKNTFELTEDTDLFFNILANGEGVTCNNFTYAIKLEKGSKATPYSQYGEGNISIEKSNKNFIKMNNSSSSKNGVDIEIKENILKLNGTATEGIDITLMSKIKLKAGKYTHSITNIKPKMFVSFDNKDNTMLRNNQSSITFTINEDTTYNRYLLWIDSGATFNNDEFILQLEEGNVATEIISHEEKTYVIPVQAPFYEGDKFIIKDGKRYEQHNLSEIIITGNEGWLYVENSQCWYVQDFFTDKLDYSEILSTHYFCMNAFATSTMLDRHMGSGSEASEYSNRNRLYIKDIDNAPTNVEEFKNWIKNLKIKVYYKLSTPTLIPCTEEQNDILDEIEEDRLYLDTTYIHSTDKIEPKISIEYDGYDGIPSTKYSSEVKACGDNINLFNKATETKNYTINTSAGIVNIPIDNQNTSDFIYIADKNNIVCNTKMTIVAFYDKDKNYISYKSEVYETLVPDTIHYIRFSYDNSIQNVKLEKGSKATPYSPYGEGNISIKKSNKNLVKINGSYFKLTENNRIKNTKRIDNVKAIENIKIKKGQVVKCRMKLFSKPTKSTTFTAYKSIGENSLGVQLSEITFGNVQNYSLNTNYDKTWTATEDCTIYYYSWGNEGAEIFEFEFSISLNNFIEYIPHEEKTYVIPVQAPFYEGDKFVIKDGKRYEQHNYEKHIFNGTEGLYSSGSASTPPIYQYNLAIDNIQLNPDNYKNTVISNYFKHIEEWNNSWLIDNVALQLKSEKVIRLQSSKYTTIHEFRTYITEQYNAGTPVYIIYKLSTPTLIECTKEQNTILDEIEEDGTYKNVTYYYSNDEVEPTMKVGYYKDPEIEHNRLQTQIDDIKTLLSTTTTSAMLLDNLEDDLVGEV